MQTKFPIKFGVGPSQEATSPDLAARPFIVRRRLTPIPERNEKVIRFTLATMGGWVETKTVMEQECVVPWPGEEWCTDVPRIYQRSCEKSIYVDVAFPETGTLEQSIRHCLESAALVGAISAVVASPAAGAAVFEAALKACLIAAGEQYAEDIRVVAGEDSKCGDWHPV